MKLKISISIFIFFCSMSISCGQIINLEKTLRTTITELSNELDKIKTSALNQGDYILSQKLNTMLLYLDDLKYTFKDELDKSLSKIDQTVQNNLKTFLDVLENKIPIVTENLDLILQNSLDDLCKKFPILCNQKARKTITYIEGAVIPYNSTNIYEILFKGPIFNDQNLTIGFELYNGRQIISTKKMVVENVVVRGFSIDHEKLNKLFKDDSCVSLSYKLYVIGPSKERVAVIFKRNVTDTIYKTKGNVLLLPKYPVKFNMKQKIASFDSLSNDTYVKIDNVLSPVPPRGKYPSPSYTFTPGIINLGERQVFKSINVLAAGGNNKYYWFRHGLPERDWDYHMLGEISFNHSVTEGGRIVNYTVVNQLVEEHVSSGMQWRVVEIEKIPKRWSVRDISVEVKVSYFQLSPKSIYKPLMIKKSIDNKLGYDTYFSEELSSNHEDYELTIEPYYWNAGSKQAVLTKSNNFLQSSYVNVTTKNIGNSIMIAVKYIGK